MSGKNLKVLITGASGLLGRQIVKYLEDTNLQSKYPVDGVQNYVFECLGLCHSRTKNKLRAVDIKNFDQVDQVIQEFKPNVIIHSAAVKNVESVENDFEAALRLNKDATENLAKIADRLGILFIYISTDYVFDGKNAPYKPNDKPNPLNKYGISKLSGEVVTTEVSKNHCIVRVPVLYGFTEPQNYGESAINVLIGNVRKQAPIKVDHQQTRYPTHCLDVSRFLTRLIIKYFEENGSEPNQVKGIFHCSGLESFTKYEICGIMAEFYNIPNEFIQPDLTTDFSLRPKNAQLDITDSYNLLNFKPVMIFKPSLKECLENFV
ncbi:methionine adenosyltransferase 2 subunit beta-like [Brachionus plicatilis]|uniref:Methionine adenosyltransferase 2 subunit beta n=1 Tax=Brachionus plicatilis TaxID=10195 RepID=A0A3M7QHX8_BRAPC|nr:methionine adenosyltransferase 2 subunit beta-like [Brachionus plicatilis]